MKGITPADEAVDSVLATVRSEAAGVTRVVTAGCAPSTAEVAIHRAGPPLNAGHLAAPTGVGRAAATGAVAATVLLRR